MEFIIVCVFNIMFFLLNKVVCDIIEYNSQYVDFFLEFEQVENYIFKKFLLVFVWVLMGDCLLNDCKQFGDKVVGLVSFGFFFLDNINLFIDFDVLLFKVEWIFWQNQVFIIEVNIYLVMQMDVVIFMLDIVCYEDVFYLWFVEYKFLLLCGFFGFGKIMMLFSVFCKFFNMEVVGFNFFSVMMFDLLIKMFE